MSIIFPLDPPTSPGPRKFKLSGNNLVGVTESPFTFEAQIQQWGGERWELEVGLPPMLHDEAEQWVAFLLALRGQVGTFLMGDPMNQSPSGTASGNPLVGGEPSLVVYAAQRYHNVLSVMGTATPLAIDDLFGAGKQVSFSSVPDVGANGNWTVASLVVVDGAFVVTWNQTGADTAVLPVTGTLVSLHNLAGSPTLYTKGWDPNQANVLVPGDYVQVGSGATQRMHKVLMPATSDANGVATLDIYPTIRETLADGDPLVIENTACCFRLATNKRSWDVDYTRTYGIDFKAVEAL